MWTGYWMMAVATLHCLLALILFSDTYLAFVSVGLVASVATDGDKLALWFLIAGLTLFVIGLCLRYMATPPKSVGMGLLGIALMGCLLQPLSGFWLLLPPAVAILFAQPTRAT